jgi:hypothetical protein
MPSPYRRDAARLKAEIIARVEAGEPQRAICAAPGMPGAQTVRNWAKADAGFAEALAAGRRRGEWTQLWGFDAAKAAAFLARAQAGEGVHALLGAPGMPTRKQYDRWRASQPAFAQAAFALLKRRDAGLGERGRARRRDFDPALADRIIVRLHAGLPRGLRLEDVLAAGPALPCKPVLRRWRRERPEFDRVLRMIFAAWRARRGALTPVPDFLVEDICSHILEGGSFASFERLPGAPSRQTLRRWLKNDLHFADEVAWACEGRDELFDELIYETARRTPPGPLAEMKRAIGPLSRQQTRLRHRPGAVHRRREEPAG